MQKVKFGYIEFLNKLKIAGYTNIGGGCFATVYGHPNKKTVLKVFGHDESYLTFCKEIINSNNPYFPQIKRIIQYQSVESHNWYVVELERLQPISDNDDIRMQVSKTYNVYLFQGKSNEYKYYGFDGYVSTCKIEELQDPYLAEAIVTLREIAKKDRMRFDIHAGNVMLRENQLVFTDPFCMW